MDYHHHDRLTIHGREQLARCVMEGRLSLDEAAAERGLSRQNASKWVRRYREDGLAGKCVDPAQTLICGELFGHPDDSGGLFLSCGCVAGGDQRPAVISSAQTPRLKGPIGQLRIDEACKYVSVVAPEVSNLRDRVDKQTSMRLARQHGSEAGNGTIDSSWT